MYENEDAVVSLTHKLELIASFLDEAASLCDRVAEEQGHRDSQWLRSMSRDAADRAAYWRKQVLTLHRNAANGGTVDAA